MAQFLTARAALDRPCPFQGRLAAAYYGRPAGPFQPLYLRTQAKDGVATEKKVEIGLCKSLTRRTRKITQIIPDLLICSVIWPLKFCYMFSSVR